MRSAVFASLALMAAAPLPAGADDCAAVAAAYEKLAVAPAYRQTIKTFGQPPVEAMAIGDMFYVNDGDGWQSIRMKPGGRAEMMSQVVGQSGGLKDCVRKPDQTLNGVAVKVYGYRPPAMGDADPSGAQTLWVGAEDGLPRRMETDGVELDISYDDVRPPKE
ncbi:hypothetical protein [Hansschlegelia zhihuaiae]|uniref:Uncharacterized protein n=1 Tax=Hansschlegelia zhihuaiae TaxID=405005 RepID=A0A4V1KHX6_9HYPH|nr:hypothetical protein [Hansschlegelia zhihuaiae]RXF68722.1 hypothetical protein EK403_19330 [Hansschlegelia zhihuaiae]